MKLRSYVNRKGLTNVYKPKIILLTYCGGLPVGSALERTSIDLALPGGVSFLRADGVSPA